MSISRCNSSSFITTSEINRPTEQIKPQNDLVTARFSDFRPTGQTVSGTGSGELEIYASQDGTKHIMKKNNVSEFYAGTLFQLILGERAPQILFVDDFVNFYVGVQFEETFQDIYQYYSDNNLLPEEDFEGLALIVVASFLLGDCDLKGLSAAFSNVGIKKYGDRQIYFKIDHEQAFTFGGKGWPKQYVLDENWKEKLKDYIECNRLEFISDQFLQKAVRDIASISLVTIEKTCDFCENQLQRYPKALGNYLEFPERLFFGLTDATTIKEAVMARFQAFHKYLTDGMI